MAYAAVGIAVGIPAAIATGRAMRGMLYGVEPHDPAALATVAGILTVAVLAASALPALKAARVDPVVALRDE
jgi:ABC-type antimicrobial peptide transport system permease subunit